MQKINFQHWIATSSAWSSDVKVHSSLCSLRCRSYNRNKANFTKNYVKVCRAGDLKRRYNVRNTPTIYAFILAVDHNATADFLGKSVSSNWKTLAINAHRKVRLISTRTRIVRGDPRHLQRYRFAFERAFAPGKTDYPRQRISRQWRERRWCARIPGCLAFLYVFPVPLRAVAPIVQHGSIRTLCNARRFTIDVLHAPWPATCILNDDPSFPSLLLCTDMSSIYVSSHASPRFRWYRDPKPARLWGRGTTPTIIHVIRSGALHGTFLPA